MDMPAAATYGGRAGPFAPRRAAPVRAFTLVELLVVLFIITLLLLIVAPIMNQAQEHGYQTICQGNLEKLSAAIRVPGATGSYSLPSPEGWLGAVVGAGAKASLRCPKGSYRIAGCSVSVVPNVVEIEPPMSTVFNDLEDNKLIRGFRERVCYKLPTNVTVDISEPGRYSKNYAKTSKVIPAGTLINCFFLHFDSIGGQSAQSSGQLSFDSEILGVIVTDESLDATDKVLGARGTTYETGRNNRGFENNAEIVVLEQDRRTFTIERFKISFPGEEVRILTRAQGWGGDEKDRGCSYGMNNQVNERLPRMGQILLVEYDQPVVDIDGREYDDDFELLLAPRHFGRANVLHVNGSVKLMWPDELDPDTEVWSPVAGAAR